MGYIASKISNACSCTVLTLTPEMHHSHITTQMQMKQFSNRLNLEPPTLHFVLWLFEPFDPVFATDRTDSLVLVLFIFLFKPLALSLVGLGLNL
jgi:hypothetical protein